MRVVDNNNGDNGSVYGVVAEALREERAIRSLTKRKIVELHRPGGGPASPDLVSPRHLSRHPNSSNNKKPYKTAGAPGRKKQRRHSHLHSHSPVASGPTPSPSENNQPAAFVPRHIQQEIRIHRAPTSRRSTGAAVPPPPPPTPTRPALVTPSAAACARRTIAKDMSAPDDGKAPSMEAKEVEDLEMVDNNNNNNGDGDRTTPAVKRPAAEMGGDDRLAEDTEMTTDSLDTAPITKKQAERPTRQRRAPSVDMIGREGGENASAGGSSEDTGGSSSDSIYPTPSSMSTYTAASRDDQKLHGPDSHSSHDAPSIDEQVGLVLQFTTQPLKEKQKGYVVSANWFTRVLARSSQPPLKEKVDKTATEGDIGPVDNSDLVLVTDPSALFKDEKGEPFIPLRPGLQMGEDFEILPEEAWKLIMKWYGLSKDSPAIVRYVHNTSPSEDTEHLQYEINPPIFTILKLSNLAASTTTFAKEKNIAPIKTLASRHTSFQKWLKNAKELASIEMSTKVRVWRVLQGLSSTGTSGIITPAASRSVSPAPGATLTASAGNSLILDLNRFVALEDGSQRELIEAPDQTANTKYNGSSSLDVHGLSSGGVIVLEEQIGGPGGGEWLSAATSKRTANRLAAPSATQGRAGLQGKNKSKSANASGRSSPAVSTTVTRGRQRKDGKARGVTGLSNLGNTCYMNSALQCVRSVEELTWYFLEDEYKADLNPSNPLAHNGDVAKAYAILLHSLYNENAASSFAPRNFKQVVGRYGPSFSGYGQQDSQEFVLFLLDGLQEDLNRIQKKPYIEKPDSTDDMVHDSAKLQGFADECWDIYKARNDSVVTDLFAGMYKSTVVCPVCDKVSIIFDPFNNLTLQLPLENVWSKTIFFFPARGPPVRIHVDMDKNASMKSLKEYIGKKVNIDPSKLIMTEIYKHKLYRLFDNPTSITDHGIGDGDDVGVFEVESAPTSYDPDKATSRQGFSYSYSGYGYGANTEEAASFETPKANCMLIPIFHRQHKPNAVRYAQRAMFGVPLFITVTREEAYDYDTILRKIIGAVDTLTTQDILHESEEDAMTGLNPSEDSDTVVTNEDDHDSSDPKIKAASVTSEDGLVDVSMRDASDAAEADNADESVPQVLRPGSFIPPMLRNMFEVKYLRSNQQVPNGLSVVEENKDYPLMSTRQPKPVKQSPPQKKNQNLLSSPATSPVSSEDELNAPATGVSLNIRSARMEDDSDDSSSPKTKEGSGSESSSDYPSANRIIRNSTARKQKNKPRQQRPSKLPFIRPGEGIVLDWTEDAFDALFGADRRDKDSLRGAPTWDYIDELPDPGLTARRSQREARKKRGITLDECLDEFGREEVLSENDAWYCPRCKEHRRATKKFELWKSPDILIIHLKRFSANRGFRDKIDALVDFPMELNLEGRLDVPEEGKSLMYDLIAVDNHYGGLGGGHYTAYAKNFIDGNWYEYNDSMASKRSDPKCVVTPAAYLLFYRRRSDGPLGGAPLARITEAVHNAAPDSEESQPASRSDSPSGEGRRLDGSSRNGSSSAFPGAAAAHQAGDGGLRGGIRLSETEADADSDLALDLDDDDNDKLPSYPSMEDMTDVGLGEYHKYSDWSFDRVPDSQSHLPRVSSAIPASYFSDDDEDGEADDDASNKAVGGGDMSDEDSRMAALASSAEGSGVGFDSVMFDESSGMEMRQIVPEDPDDYDELPVVELVAPDEEK
ncbi:hypothetical protein AJ80_02018 [Polytolypa hystricis UAMH7299]|uniref:ubiquitinyl hydrolase 1 n=1 Tax=Polytolypa hystricis (strain UAMH7299) TaxID=1447883 RepID=A0A2B7YQK4_POLH7|nr:hypothetical protein AJ80_02018 [Polytolypa hystricis UAMH7299]